MNTIRSPKKGKIGRNKKSLENERKTGQITKLQGETASSGAKSMSKENEVLGLEKMGFARKLQTKDQESEFGVKSPCPWTGKNDCKIRWSSEGVWSSDAERFEKDLIGSEDLDKDGEGLIRKRSDSEFSKEDESRKMCVSGEFKNKKRKSEFAERFPRKQQLTSIQNFEEIDEINLRSNRKIFESEKSYYKSTEKRLNSKNLSVWEETVRKDLQNQKRLEALEQSEKSENQEIYEECQESPGSQKNLEKHLHFSTDSKMTSPQTKKKSNQQIFNFKEADDLMFNNNNSNNNKNNFTLENVNLGLDQLRKSARTVLESRKESFKQKFGETNSFRSETKKKSKRKYEQTLSTKIMKSNTFDGLTSFEKQFAEKNLKIVWKLGKFKRKTENKKKISLIEKIRNQLSADLGMILPDNLEKINFPKNKNNKKIHFKAMTIKNFLKNLGFDRNFDLIFQNLPKDQSESAEFLSKKAVREAYTDFFTTSFPLKKGCLEENFQSVMKLFFMNLKIPETMLGRLTLREKIYLVLIFGSKILHLISLGKKFCSERFCREMEKINPKNEKSSSEKKSKKAVVKEKKRKLKNIEKRRSKKISKKKGMICLQMKQQSDFEKTFGRMTDCEFEDLFEGVESLGSGKKNTKMSFMENQRTDFLFPQKISPLDELINHNKNKIFLKKKNNFEKEMRKFVYLVIFSIRELLRRFNEIKKIERWGPHTEKRAIELFQDDLNFDPNHPLAPLPELLAEIDLNLLQEFSIFYWTSFLVKNPKREVKIYSKARDNQSESQRNGDCQRMMSLDFQKIKVNNFFDKKAKKTNEAYKYIQNKIYNLSKSEGTIHLWEQPSIEFFLEKFGYPNESEIPHEMKKKMKMKLKNLTCKNVNWSKKNIQFFKMSTGYQKMEISKVFRHIIHQNLEKFSGDKVISAGKNMRIFSEKMLRFLLSSKRKKPWTTFEILDSIVKYCHIKGKDSYQDLKELREVE